MTFIIKILKNNKIKLINNEDKRLSHLIENDLLEENFSEELAINLAKDYLKNNTINNLNEINFVIEYEENSI